jgi:hypothetical protein
VDVVDESAEDGEVVEVVGGGVDVGVDEGEQFEVEVLPLFDQFDERVDALDEGDGRLLHHNYTIAIAKIIINCEKAANLGEIDGE